MHALFLLQNFFHAKSIIPVLMCCVIMLYYAAGDISAVNVKRVSIFMCSFPFWKAESFQFLRISYSQSPTWLMLMPWCPMAPSHQQLPCWSFRNLRSSQWDLTARPYVVYEYHDHNETTLVIDDALVPTRCQAINNYRVDPVCPVTSQASLTVMCFVYISCVLHRLLFAGCCWCPGAQKAPSHQ